MRIFAALEVRLYQVLFQTEVGVYSMIALILTIGVGFVVSFGVRRILREPEN
ncbi:MAG: DUF3149 domain-containing protein [Vulcanimicrobiota bacterium]